MTVTRPGCNVQHYATEPRRCSKTRSTPASTPASSQGLIEERARRRDRPATDVGDWLLGWHDREGAWTNLRNVQHWIDRAAP